LASLAQESDGGGLRLLAYASESAPIFTPEFPKAEPYHRERGAVGDTGAGEIAERKQIVRIAFLKPILR
jgi:hypothetical protein